MVIQIYDISLPAAFKELSSLYSIDENEKGNGNLAIEIRGEQIDFPFLNIIKEKGIKFYTLVDENSCNILIPGNLYEFETCCAQLKGIAPEGIRYRIKTAIQNYKNYENSSYFIGDKKFSTGSPAIMGILNVTPDSFSDGGKYFDSDAAFLHAEEMIKEGADIIDIGGESTRPGSPLINEEEEVQRIIPVIQKIHSRYPDILISADTNKASVAEKALKGGASIINDISGATFDVNLLKIVKEYNAALVLMHIKGIPQNMQQKTDYKRLVSEVYDFLYRQSSEALYEGVNNIIIDPGIGFAKTAQMNIEIINRLKDFKSMGFPVMIGNSRKSFLGKITGEDVANREVPSVIVDTISVMNGAAIIRTHNVKHGVYLKKIYNAAGSLNV